MICSTRRTLQLPRVVLLLVGIVVAVRLRRARQLFTPVSRKPCSIFKRDIPTIGWAGWVLVYLGLFWKLSCLRAFGRICPSGAQSGCAIHGQRLGMAWFFCLEFGPLFPSTCSFGYCVFYGFPRGLSCYDYCAASFCSHLDILCLVFKIGFWEVSALFGYSGSGCVLGIASG